MSAEQEHGPQFCGYDMNRSQFSRCVIICLCGKTFDGHNFEDVGGYFDDHLEAMGVPDAALR